MIYIALLGTIVLVIAYAYSLNKNYNNSLKYKSNLFDCFGLGVAAMLLLWQIFIAVGENI